MIERRRLSQICIAMTFTVAGSGCLKSLPFFGGGKDKNMSPTASRAKGQKVAPTVGSSAGLAAAGSAKQLARVTSDDRSDEFNPRLSVDGAWLLYVAAGNDFARIVKSKPDGKNAVILTAEDGQAYAPSWLPSGSSYVAV